LSKMGLELLNSYVKIFVKKVEFSQLPRKSKI